ncbi:MAG: sugar MFS transporter [Myxococcota bacterium]
MVRSPLGVFVVYFSGLLQGLTVVAFPASGTVLREMHGLSNEAYGSIFLPQTALTIVGSVFGGSLAAKLGLRWLLVLACLASALSQVFLLSTAFFDSEFALPLLLAGTAAMGLGFGVAAAPLNAYPGRLFPARPDPALVALHTMLGAGFSLGPLMVSGLVAADAWSTFPVLVLVANVVVGGLAVVASLPSSPAAEQGGGARAAVSWGPVLLFGLVAVLYAFAEGTFSNWASIFLHDARGVPESAAALAISGFWGALTVGRLLVSALVARVRSELIWLVLPVGMALTFLLLPLAQNAVSGVGLFILAGLCCSAFFPLTVAIASKRFPGHEALVSSMLIAALMVGVGAGSFALGAFRASASFDLIYRASAVYPIAALLLGLLLVTTRRPGASKVMDT